MQTSVALTLFNQPEAVQRVFEVIRSARPVKLFLISDAGRTAKEQELVEESRQIAEAVDWPCEVFKNYSDANMGARARISSGISWVFGQVDRAIILEHDCLPDPTFFQFCEELLERYKDDERVMHIGGTNFQSDNKNFICEDSYYFSLVPQIWGFATWARAWKHYDVDLKEWPQVKESAKLKSIFKNPAVLERWVHRFEQYYRGEAKSWDGQWTFACLIKGGLCINPAVNLVSNIGYGPSALNAKNGKDLFANIPTQPMHFPLLHPKSLIPNEIAEAYTFKYVFDINRTMRQRMQWFFRSRFPVSYRALKNLLK